ncbi:hypothetical protein [Vibrio owensii]|uniref:hypothetical protein n=1 Tax=Vibrio owensii TaxID=696485 RepID=UPI003CC52305
MFKSVGFLMIMTCLSGSAFASSDDYTTGIDDVKRWYEENQDVKPHPEWVDSTKMPFTEYLGEVGKGMDKMLDSMLTPTEHENGKNPEGNTI